MVGQISTRRQSTPTDNGNISYAIGSFMMEFVTIFFPLLEVYKSSRERRAISAAIAEWENKNHDLDSVQSSVLQISTKFEGPERQNKANLCNMQALEKALESNARELLDFAAMKQFTGENIVFLTRVRTWKERWNRTTLAKTPMPLETKSRLYKSGKDLFDRNISLHTAQFPVNIESNIYRSLEGIFLGTDRSSPPWKSVIAPFAQSRTAITAAQRAAIGFEDDDSSKQPGVTETTLAIPFGFDGHVFDQAERSIKYMVLTNTWPRYLDSPFFCTSTS